MGKPRAASRSRSQRLSESLLRAAAPTFSSWHVPEPKLQFAGGQLCEDPKTGLTAAGPSALEGTPRNAIRVGVIGDGVSIQMLGNWIKDARQKIYAGLNAKGSPFDTLYAPSFPGFSIDSPFQCEVELSENLTVVLTEREIAQILEGNSFSDRVRVAVQMISAKLCVLSDKEPSPDIVVIAIPKVLEQAIGPDARANQGRPVALTKLQKRDRKRAAKDAKTGQRQLEFRDAEEAVSDISFHFRDFHNCLKAHAMKAKLATQLVWHSTLAKSRGTEDPATTAWNFFTALYYKAGNVPWRLRFATQRTCFVGITFYRETADPNAPTRTCLAQAFSESGEGLVLRGERITWDQERDKKPHLGHDDAKELLTRVLALYKEHFYGNPNRVVLHKTSRYWRDELKGFRAALGDNIHTYDFLALERRGLRFLRLGMEPPLRGTVIQIGTRNYLIYTQGYLPFMRQYPGMRIPNPLEVVEHHGDSSADRVCGEILALTKLNWNSCKFASSNPITVSFARQVATIIKELPLGVDPATKYRFYM